MKINKRKDTGAEVQVSQHSSAHLVPALPLAILESDKADRRIKYSSMGWSRARPLILRVIRASLLMSWALVFFLVE